MSDIDDIAAFMEERLNEREETAHWSGPARVAWLTFRDDEGRMLYTTVAADGGSEVPDAPWCADGHELPEPASARVVFDPELVLAGVEAQRSVLHEWAALSGVLEGAAMRGAPLDKVMAFQVRVLEGVIRKLCAEWAAHPGYKAEWKP